LSSAVALALALLLSATALLPATAPEASRRVPAAGSWLPAFLLAGAVLTLLDRPGWPDWLVLAALGLALTTAAIVLIRRRAPAVPGDRHSARF